MFILKGDQIILLQGGRLSLRSHDPLTAQAGFQVDL